MSTVEPLLSLAEQAVAVIRPLEHGLADEEEFSKLLRRFGWDVNGSGFSIADVRSRIGIDGGMSSVEAGFGNLTAPADFPPLEDYLSLLDAIKSVIGVLRGLGGTPAPSGIPAGAWSDFTAEALDALVVEYVSNTHAGLAAGLIGTGVIEVEEVDPGAVPGRLPHVRRRLRWDRLPRIVSDPRGLMREAYGWRQAAGIEFESALYRLGQLLGLLGLPVEVRTPTPAQLDDYYDAGNPHRAQVRELKATLLAGTDGAGNSLDVSLAIMPIPESGDRGGPPQGIAIVPSLAASAVPPAQLFWPYSIELEGSGGQAAYEGARLELLPSGVRGSLTAAGQATIDVRALLKQEFASPAILVGSMFSHRLELDSYEFGIAARGPVADPDLALRAAIGKGRLVVDAGSADGFLAEILGGGLWTFEFAVGLEWSSKSGVHLDGSGAVEAKLPLNLTLGPVELRDLLVRAAAAAGHFTLSAGVNGNLALGPVAASVENLGAQLLLDPVPSGSPPGIFGDLDVGFGFKPPDGIGLEVDAGVVKGGGFLGFEPARAEYFGLLELSLKDVVQIKAIGLLTTRLPDGSDGFSLLLLVTGEFPPIQLGFGFTLNGVGGLAGVNRTMVVEALRAGLRAHTLDSILFPPDPVRNAPRIISDLRSVFPPARERYVFGPMLEIGWGTPTLITAEIGVLLELPEPIRIAILGQIKAVLPAEEVPIVQLHIDVLGVIDFEAKTLAIDATIYDSSILVYTLTGDMALRLDWGDMPSFAVSLGGLHPRFNPPPGFPALRRLTLSLGSSNNPRLSCETYLALTSNSVQFGSRVDLYASAAGFAVHGYLGFDVLIILSPFSFTADMEAGVELLRGSTKLMSIHLAFTLSGPTPWHARGSASFKILFLKISVHFDVSWGEDEPATVPAADARTPLVEALADSRNWHADLPPGSERAVTLAPAPAAADAVLVHPLGQLAVRQTVVPLNATISRFGTARPDRWNHFEVTDVTLGGGGATAHPPLQDRFARAQFFELSDEDKLSKPAFESMDAGVEIGSGEERLGHRSLLDLRYETGIVDQRELPLRFLSRLHAPAAAAFAAQLRFGAPALSSVLNSGDAKYVPPGTESAVSIGAVTHVIASTEDLAIRTDLTDAGGTTLSAAESTLSAHLGAHPEERGRVQVIPLHEAVAA